MNKLIVLILLVVTTTTTTTTVEASGYKFSPMDVIEASEVTQQSIGIANWEITNTAIAGLGYNNELLVLDVFDSKNSVVRTFEYDASIDGFTYSVITVEAANDLPTNIKERVELFYTDLQNTLFRRMSTQDKCTKALLACGMSVSTGIVGLFKKNLLGAGAMVTAVPVCLLAVDTCYNDFPTDITEDFIDFCNEHPGAPDCSKTCAVFFDKFGDMDGYINPSFCDKSSKPNPPGYCIEYPTHPDCIDYCNSIKKPNRKPDFCKLVPDDYTTANDAKEKPFMPPEMLPKWPDENDHYDQTVCYEVYGEASYEYPEAGTTVIHAGPKMLLCL